jgi:hypothetical protein
MDLEADNALHAEIFLGPPPQSPTVTVTLDKDWFRMYSSRNKKPTADSVKRYWAALKQPLNSGNALPVLYMIRRAMLDWPQMGAAIGKLARKEFEDALAEIKVNRRRQEYLDKKLLRQSALDVNKVIKARDEAVVKTSEKKNFPVKAAGTQKATKKH